jgi:hypothetical protein
MYLPLRARSWTEILASTYDFRTCTKCLVRMLIAISFNYGPNPSPLSRKPPAPVQVLLIRLAIHLDELCRFQRYQLKTKWMTKIRRKARIGEPRTSPHQYMLQHTLLWLLSLVFRQAVPPSRRLRWSKGHINQFQHTYSPDIQLQAAISSIDDRVFLTCAIPRRMVPTTNTRRGGVLAPNRVSKIGINKPVPCAVCWWNF